MVVQLLISQSDENDIWKYPLGWVVSGFAIPGANSTLPTMSMAGAGLGVR